MALKVISQSGDHSVNRRQFIRQAGTLASLTVLPGATARSYAANQKIKLGLIGCGGRGSWIADLFMKHGGYELTALADYFPDKVDEAGRKFNVPSDRRYTGLSCYKRLLDSHVDAVAIESPPYFHPEQAAAAVEAGVNVYLAKPIAVDVPGCKSVEESGLKAAGKKLCFRVDFQTRAQEFYLEALKRVHAGALGDFAFGEAIYHADNPFNDKYQFLESDPNNAENRLRAWGLDRELSGDIITEQNIHTLDVASWIMNSEPVFAVGTGGLTARRKLGSCWDHFAILYQYPNQVGVTFSSRQFNGHGTRPEGIRNRMFGSKGVLETEYGGQVLIRGDNFYRGGQTPRIYEEGAVNNIASFHSDIQNGRFENLTVTPSVRSNLLTILGRTAAYEQRQVTWAELMKSQTRLQPLLKGLKD
jgi:myo-inositol 2-dehydrogenase / D-chiro-inositol 1-dehydrogenase